MRHHRGGHIAAYHVGSDSGLRRDREHHGCRAARGTGLVDHRRTHRALRLCSRAAYGDPRVRTGSTDVGRPVGAREPGGSASDADAAASTCPELGFVLGLVRIRWRLVGRRRF
ncbi:hypothetical protein KTR9_2567 [Gordonia sp. KTR9]|nr:hypothetical protein KTR9_2567 [Gordonia sp. KTR9]